MTGQAGLLELSAGSALLLGGREWTVASVEPQYGRVLLRSGGEEQRRSIRWLAHHPDCRPVPDDDAAVPARPAGQPPALGDLTDYRREVVRLRVAHLLEAETGFRSGDPLHPEPGEPRPAYDPRATMLGQRRRAKAAELNALGGEEAALLGLGQVSERTLRRMAGAWKDRGPAGCIDGRWLRPRAGHPSITEEVREAIFAVRKETRDRSRTSMKDKHVLVAQYVAEKFGADVPVPGYWTLKKAWREWFGPGGTRPRYDRSADGIEAAKVHVTVSPPGQVVALDTTPLPVKVREHVFGDPVTASLTLALRHVHAFGGGVPAHAGVGHRGRHRDAAARHHDAAADAGRLGPGDGMALSRGPRRHRRGLRRAPGRRAAVLRPGDRHYRPRRSYKSRTAVAAQQALGCNILPARVLRPQDKAACERAFGAFRSLLFEHLPGYTGIDVADRGADPEAAAVLTMTQMEHVVAEWIISVWQNRALGEHAPAWGPGEEHSPNMLFAAAMNQGGFALQIPRAELYYELLPVHYVKVHADRGVKIGGLWYGRADPALKPYEGKPSGRGGRHKDAWVIRDDRRDRRQVFFQDPADPGKWHALRWNGLPPEGEVPAFSDKTADELLREARVAGLSPKSDDDLLPVLLRLLGGVAPVSRWPSQMGKKEKKGRARETAQGDQAARDRRGRGPAEAGGGGTVVPLRWPEQATRARDAIDAERRRRREQAVPQRPAPPGTLGDKLRSTSLLALPHEDEE